MIITETETEILLILNASTVSSIEKEDVEDFTTRCIGNVGVIDFKTNSGKSVSFALIDDEFDTALKKLINITDRMGI